MQRALQSLFNQLHQRVTISTYSGTWPTAAPMPRSGMSYGGSLIRPEATGFGCVYFAQEMLKRSGQRIDGKRVAISGSGNVAQYAARKVMDLGGKVISLSDSF